MFNLIFSVMDKEELMMKIQGFEEYYSNAVSEEDKMFCLEKIDELTEQLMNLK